MIKLKDLLKETTTPEMYKVITAKDNPPFMTEEEWQNKWANKQPLTEGKINDLLKRAFYRLASGLFDFNPPNDDKSVAAMKDYLYTGKITPADSKRIFKLFEKQLKYNGGVVGIILAPIIGLFPAAAVAIIIYSIIKKYGAKWLTPTKDNNFIKPAQAEKYKNMDEKDWTRKVRPLAGKGVKTIEAKILKTFDKKGYEWYMGIDRDVKKAGLEIQKKIK